MEPESYDSRKSSRDGLNPSPNKPPGPRLANLLILTRKILVSNS